MAVNGVVMAVIGVAMPDKCIVLEVNKGHLGVNGVVLKGN
jgi:hypothetical protein